MANELRVPDIGSDDEVDVIEILVSPGDSINEDDSVITLESDKATMEVPSDKAGTIEKVVVSVGDKVSTGSVILHFQEAGEKSVPQTVAEPKEKTASAEEITLTIPDIGTDDKVEVIEVLVKGGDDINKDDSIITLESEKATMEVPATAGGKVTAINVSVGDKVGAGDAVLTLQGAAVSEIPAKKTEDLQAPVQKAAANKLANKPAAEPAPVATNGDVHASPAVRRLAREFGVDLGQVSGTGRKNRIIKEDVQNFVKTRLQSGTGGNFNIAAAPSVDFSKFGEIETQALSKIKRLTGANVHRSWVTVPHVTHFDEADITELERFRKANKKQAEAKGAKLTPIVFIMKAVVAALKEFPTFNASLDASGDNLILKKYFHIGVAVDTPNGLVVPVIRDVDQKGFLELAIELGEISKKAREKGLMPNEMAGSCFTISSLGGIGGTAFTPIVNTPDVAILGLSRSSMKPVYCDNEFVPRLILPLSLSYDHRVIDGAEAARFSRFLAEQLEDIRRLLL